MQVVSSTEFAAHHDKYLDMAVGHDICIKRGESIFQITYEPATEEQPVLEPDEDLCRAITAEKLLEGVHEDIRRKFASRV